MEPVTGRAAQRADDPVPDQQGGDRRVQQRPDEARLEAADEGRAVGELMAERQRDRQVRVEVQVIPGVVGQAAARRAGGHQADTQEQEPGYGRHQDVRVGGQQGARLAGQSLVRGDRIAPDDEQGVRDDHADDVAAAHRVPAGQPVGADPPFQRRQPGHERDQHDHPVAREQAEDASRVGEPVAQAVDRWRIGPPQRDHGQRAGDDQGQDQPGSRAQVFPCLDDPA